MHEEVPEGYQWSRRQKIERQSQNGTWKNGKSGVFEKVKLSELPSMKKKSNGTLCGRINVRGFKQVEGQHFDASSISAPFRNGMTIKLVLMLMLASAALHMRSTPREHFFAANSKIREDLHQVFIGIRGIL